MQVHNMLEKNGQGYINGNIRLVKIHPDKITVYKKDGGVLTYQNTEMNSKPRGTAENRPDFDLVAPE